MPERPGGTRSAAVFTRGRPYVLAAMVFAVVLGTLFSLAVGLSATWVVMVFGGAATLVVIAWWPSFREFAIAGYFVTLPILITKALVAGSASYGPVLEATLPDCFLVMMAVAWLMERRWEPAPVAIGPAPRRRDPPLGLVLRALRTQADRRIPLGAELLQAARRLLPREPARSHATRC